MYNPPPISSHNISSLLVPNHGEKQHYSQPNTMLQSKATEMINSTESFALDIVKIHLYKMGLYKITP